MGHEAVITSFFRYPFHFSFAFTMHLLWSKAFIWWDHLSFIQEERAHVVLLIPSCCHLPLILTTDHAIRRQPQKVSWDPGTHFSLFPLCSKCICPLMARINHSSRHKSSPTHLFLPAHPGHEESEIARCQSQFLGFPGVASGKELTCQCRRHKRHWFNPSVGKIPWREA